jgi:hypothetical protein
MFNRRIIVVEHFFCVTAASTDEAIPDNGRFALDV